MKVSISYEFDPNYPNNPYWAKAEYCGKNWMVCGESFEKAKERLLVNLYKLPPVPPAIPEPEEIEVTLDTSAVAHVN